MLTGDHTYDRACPARCMEQRRSASAGEQHGARRMDAHLVLHPSASHSCVGLLTDCILPLAEIVVCTRRESGCWLAITSACVTWIIQPDAAAGDAKDLCTHPREAVARDQWSAGKEACSARARLPRGATRSRARAREGPTRGPPAPAASCHPGRPKGRHAARLVPHRRHSAPYHVTRCPQTVAEDRLPRSLTRLIIGMQGATPQTR